MSGLPKVRKVHEALQDLLLIFEGIERCRTDADFSRTPEAKDPRWWQDQKGRALALVATIRSESIGIRTELDDLIPSPQKVEVRLSMLFSQLFHHWINDITPEDVGPNQQARDKRLKQEVRDLASQLSGVLERPIPTQATAKHALPISRSDLPVLGEDAQVFRDILIERRPEDALTGPKLCDLFQKRTGKGIEDNDFRSRIAPPLKEWGMRNKRRLGYYFPTNAAARDRG